MEEEYPDDEEIEIKDESEENKEKIDKKKNENINLENDNKLNETFNSNLSKEKDKVDSNKEIIWDTIDKERKKGPKKRSHKEIDTFNLTRGKINTLMSSTETIIEKLLINHFNDYH